MNDRARLRKHPPPAGFVLGKKIDLESWRAHTIAVGEAGRVYCFVGYIAEDQPRDLAYYAPSVALRRRDGRASHRFVSLSRGTLSRSGFLSDDEYYRVLPDRYVVLPTGTESYFGVISERDRSEDLELTRSVFGGTYQEIESVAIALAIVVGRESRQIMRLPRLTFSKARDNRCDVTGCSIPREFPYVAFEEAQQDWSHVSLHGLYRLLSFLCPEPQQSPVWQALRDAGIEEDILKMFISNGNGYPPAISERDEY